MRISYELVEFYQKKENSSFDTQYEINLNGITEIFELNARIGVKIFKRQEWESQMGKENVYWSNSITCRLDFDKIKASGCVPVLRTRRQGDYIRPLGMKGRKKLQDFFVDEKIHRHLRNKTPILCLGAEVIWVIGSRISENYKVRDDTERIILLEYSSKT